MKQDKKYLFMWGKTTKMVTLSCSWLLVWEFGGGWMHPPSISMEGQILDRHPSPRVQQQRLLQPQLYSLWPAQSCQMTGSGSWRRETTPAERIKPVISREGWAASLSAAVITAGATACVGVNSLTGRITSQVSWATSPVLPRTRLHHVSTVALAGQTHQLLHPVLRHAVPGVTQPLTHSPQEVSPAWLGKQTWVRSFQQRTQCWGAGGVVVKNEWSSGLRTFSRGWREKKEKK